MILFYLQYFQKQTLNSFAHNRCILAYCKFRYIEILSQKNISKQYDSIAAISHSAIDNYDHNAPKAAAAEWEREKTI